jgi:hypothetical protein
MSRFVLYKKPCEISTEPLIFSRDILKSLVWYKICCDKAKLQLPPEIWRHIAWYLCRSKSVSYEKLRILEWLTEYFDDMHQHRENPMLVGKDTSVATSIMYLMIDAISLDFGYHIMSMVVNNDETSIPFLGDICIGIMKDPAITKLDITPTPSLSTNSFTYTQEQLKERKVRVYTHTTGDIINKCNLFEERFLNEIIFWTIPGIIPYLCCASDTRLHLHITTTEPIKQIQLLYLFMNLEMRDEIIESRITYEGSTYFSGHFLRG